MLKLHLSFPGARTGVLWQSHCKIPPSPAFTRARPFRSCRWENQKGQNVKDESGEQLRAGLMIKC